MGDPITCARICVDKCMYITTLTLCCRHYSPIDNSGNPRQVPKNARRRESKGSQEHQPQVRTNNNNAGQTQQHYRNNSERRSRWNKLQAAAPNYNSQIRLSASSEASGLGDEDADDHEDIYLETAEWDSVMVPGSKKHNLNHLLNFHYAPIHTKRESHHQWQGRSSKKQSASSAVVYNKDQFLQANCNFIVSDTGDYKGHCNNPDTLVDWQLIEEVVIRSAEEPKCPICLFPPVAAKMTKCGHVYCWPCILHYLALSDKEWRKCPICYDAVRIKDLRSTVAWPYHEYQLEETVDFQLMCRKKGSLDVVRVGRDEERGGVKRATQLPHLFDVREQQIVHSKLILANKVEVSSILERERCELQAQMQTDGPEGFNTPETMFISQAMDLLEDRTKELQKCIAVGGSHNYSNNATVAECDGDTDDTHYFYQAVDGQHLYMHSLNLRMLQAQFGSLAICPPVMTGRIVQREHFSVCEGLRKRSKYLQHLPLTSIICVAEVAFREEVFTAEVHGMFAEEMAQRKRDRQKRTRDEKKRERKINDMNEREMGKFLAQSAGGGFVSQAADFYPFVSEGAFLATTL